MATININILKKVDHVNPYVTKAIYDAMLEDLIERRKPRDPDLFRDCMELVIPEDHRYCDVIQDFTELAGGAFTEYHALRARGAYMENGKVVIPAPTASDDAGEDQATETEDDPVDVDGGESEDGGCAPSATDGDYSPSSPWNAPGMNPSDFF